MEGPTVLSIIIIALLVFSFIVSGAEIALFSLTYKDINVLKTKKDTAWKRIVHLLEEPKTLLASLLIANTFINIAIIIFSNFLIEQLLPIQGFWWVALKLGIIASLLILFGEVMPKMWASQSNLWFAYSVSPVVEIIHYLFRRVGISLVGLSDNIEQFLGKKAASYSLKEFNHDIDISNKDASEEEKNILKGIAKFRFITVRQIMRTRLDVSGIDHSISFHSLIRRVEELHYSRLPVYKSSLDEVLGILNTKDLIAHLDEPDDFNWQSLLRQPYFVHEQKLIEDLLGDFQGKRIHFAVVVDEFGGTSGIVTLEDIMEEIIGDIKDEFDEEESINGKIDENNYVFEGRTMINDVCKMLDIAGDTFDQVRGDSDSVAGLVLELAGKFPAVNDVVSIGDFEFTVLEVDRNRILKVKLRIKTPE
jgi:gliding motility-associated protein GldE